MDAPNAAAGFDFAILEASTVVAAIVVAGDGRVVAANARMRRFLGIADSGPYGQLPDYLVDASASEAWRDAARARCSIEVELRGFGGATQVFRGDLLPHGEGSNRRIVGVFVEGDERKALRAAAQHSARMEALGSLTAGVAHDFNNLLTVLVGNLYLIGEEVRERPRVFEKLKAARDAGKRGTELIKQLMTFARREELTVGVIDPQNVIADLLPLLRRALGARITLETKLQANVGAVRASVAQLESVVVNLAVNARDAIEGKGTISIEVIPADVTEQEATLRGLARGGRYIAVTVRDTGSGIPPEALSRVFEPFFSTKRERGGTGLGLSMVRWFAEHAGGAAAIESVVGQGTTVTLMLPRIQPEQADSIEMTMPLSTLPTGNERVVVLALDEALRATIHQTLEVLGYRVRVASGAEDLLAAVAAEQTELLMVDGLGRGDADILIRARAAQPKLRIIATADPSRGAERIAGVGIASLAKPFTLADLAGTVRRTLDAAADAL
ncbi:MAG TPA: ATP-binding protein [Gammaproteobacteria bacterium]|nr:ATP-binding protein [Gammaproteobacteria bacterium]